MSNADYDSILDRSGDEITEPKLYPQGTWLLKCVGVAVKKDSDDHDVVMFAYVGREPKADVDESELQAAGDDYEGNRVWKRFTIETKRDGFDLKRHVELHGVEVGTRPLREAAKDVKGCEVVAYMGERSYQTRDGETKRDNTVSKFMSVEQYEQEIVDAA